MKVLVRFIQRCGWITALFFWGTSVLAQELPALRIDPTQITTSGISSGAYMAVQFGVAHSSAVSGVAATAGGPYFCAGNDVRWGSAALGGVIARCMQGDPAMPARPISPARQDEMVAAARAWAAQGRIDPLSSLASQRVWLFHGYNDGIVKRPVVEALRDWYGQFVPAGQVFFRNDLRAAHAQVSASCTASGQGGVKCNPCARTGDNFINTCPDPATGTGQYDAAGAALQWFHGPLKPRAEGRLGGTVVVFDQRPYVHRGTQLVSASDVLLANTGYVYVPAVCAAGEACRLHIAFHGCQQQEARVGLDFVRGAGFNEWADTNRIVVLYPQTVATTNPFNPQGCWDWWGYSDSLFDRPGRFATREGAQIAAVWRMVERLRAGGDARVESTPAEPALYQADVTARSVALTWPVVTGAASYRIERSEEPASGAADSAAAIHVLQVSGPPVADHGLMPEQAYRYVLHALNASGASIGGPVTLQVHTAKAPPACDPYYSLSLDHQVNKWGSLVDTQCP